MGLKKLYYKNLKLLKLLNGCFHEISKSHSAEKTIKICCEISNFPIVPKMIRLAYPSYIRISMLKNEREDPNWTGGPLNDFGIQHEIVN